MHAQSTVTLAEELGHCLVQPRVDFPRARSIIKKLGECDDLAEIHSQSGLPQRLRVLLLSVLAVRFPDTWMNKFLEVLSAENCLMWSDFSILLEGASGLERRYFDQVRHSIVSNPHMHRYPEWLEALDTERRARVICSECHRTLDVAPTNLRGVLIGVKDIRLCVGCVAVLLDRLHEIDSVVSVDRCDSCEVQKQVIEMSAGHICGTCLKEASAILNR